MTPHDYPIDATSGFHQRPFEDERVLNCTGRPGGPNEPTESVRATRLSCVNSRFHTTDVCPIWD